MRCQEGRGKALEVCGACRRWLSKSLVAYSVGGLGSLLSPVVEDGDKVSWH